MAHLWKYKLPLQQFRDLRNPTSRLKLNLKKNQKENLLKLNAGRLSLSDRMRPWSRRRKKLFSVTKTIYYPQKRRVGKKSCFSRKKKATAHSPLNSLLLSTKSTKTGTRSDSAEATLSWTKRSSARGMTCIKRASHSRTKRRATLSLLVLTSRLLKYLPLRRPRPKRLWSVLDCHRGGLKCRIWIWRRLRDRTLEGHFLEELAT